MNPCSREGGRNVVNKMRTITGLCAGRVTWRRHLCARPNGRRTKIRVLHDRPRREYLARDMR
jgi:hypothetical protein